MEAFTVEAQGAEAQRGGSQQDSSPISQPTAPLPSTHPPQGLVARDREGVWWRAPRQTAPASDAAKPGVTAVAEERPWGPAWELQVEEDSRTAVGTRLLWSGPGGGPGGAVHRRQCSPRGRHPGGSEP